MKSYIMAAFAAAAIAGMPTAANADTVRENPFLAPYTNKYEIPPFDKIQNSDYMPALRAAIAAHDAEIAAIVNNPEAPTFANTIEALDNSGKLLDKVANVYMALSESDSSPELQAVGEEFEPMLASHSDEVSMNEGLFKRIKALYDARETLGLAKDQQRLLEKYYKSFTCNGALLDAKG